MSVQESATKILMISYTLQQQEPWFQNEYQKQYISLYSQNENIEIALTLTFSVV